VDGTGAGLQLIQIVQAPQAAQIAGSLTTVSIRSARPSFKLNRSEFDAASFFEKDADYVEALPGRAA
jgi:hypothetical protein